jgi:hypothetical protein
MARQWNVVFFAAEHKWRALRSQIATLDQDSYPVGLEPCEQQILAPFQGLALLLS